MSENPNLCIVVARHAEQVSDMGKGRLPSAHALLSPKGYLQAEMLSEELRLSGIFPDVIFSSDLPRAVLTAQEIGKDSKTQIILMAGLREVDWGGLVGYPLRKLDPLPGGNTDNYSIDAGQEPFSDVVDRVYECMDDILQVAQSGQTIAIIAHGTIVRLIQFFLKNPGVKPNVESDLPVEDIPRHAEGSILLLGEQNEVLASDKIKPPDIYIPPRFQRTRRLLHQLFTSQ